MEKQQVLRIGIWLQTIEKHLSSNSLAKPVDSCHNGKLQMKQLVQWERKLVQTIEAKAK
jgi:hypothetical protein